MPRKRATLATIFAIALWMLVLPFAGGSASARGGRGGGRGARGGRNSGGAASARGRTRTKKGKKDKDTARNRERDARELRDALKRAAADDAV